MVDKYPVRRWDIYRWYRIFRELGMEFIESQLSNMGLEALPNVSDVRTVARWFLEQYQEHSENEDEALVRETFVRIAQVTSEEMAEALYRWGRESFQHEIGRWHRIFDLLSMERVEPFLSEMGLKLPNTLVMRVMARRFLEQYQERTGDEVQDEALIERTFAQIGQLTDEETAEYFYKWGMLQFPLEGPDIAREFTWSHLLEGLADSIESRGNDQVLLVLNEGKARAVVEIVRSYKAEKDTLKDRIEETEQQPQSEWEKRVYESYKVENMLEISPLDSMRESIEFRLFHKTLERIKSLFTAEEMERLLQWGKSQAEGESIPLSLVEFPPNPGVS